MPSPSLAATRALPRNYCFPIEPARKPYALLLLVILHKATPEQGHNSSYTGR